MAAPRLMEHQLPSNATVNDRVLASMHQRLLDLDVSRLRHLWDPWQCDLRDLHFLAWTLSVDIWDPAWDERKKRSVVANAVAHHKLKGTQTGIETYLDLVDCEARRFVRPPARGFRVPALTGAEWRAYLDRLPQLRVYPFSIPASGGDRRFRMRSNEFRGGFREKTAGPSLFGRRATYVYEGVETEISLENVEGFAQGTVERVSIASRVTRDFHAPAARFRTAGFREPSTAAAGIFTVRMNEDASPTAMVKASLVPQNVLPVRVAQRHVVKPAEHFHDGYRSFRGANFRGHTKAPLFLYDKVSLIDGDRMPLGMKARYYRGNKRYGIEPFTAQVTVSVPMKRSPSRGFGSRFRNGFRVPTDMTKLNNACDAVVAAKSLRDTVLLDTVTHRVVRLKDKKRLGTFKLGEIIKIA